MSACAAPALNISKTVFMLRLFANTSRLRIAIYLLSGEQSVATIETVLMIRQPNLSQHLAELREAGFVVARREGKSVFYSLASSSVHQFVASLLRDVHPTPVPPKVHLKPGVSWNAGASNFVVPRSSEGLREAK
jgi:ArsR family transcriptional regulator